jgi:pimeloyl-ACP methyl ester carboxylesterase
MNDANARQRMREGILRGGLHYLTEGSGPPLVIFSTVTPSPYNPRGLARLGVRRFIRPLTQHFTVYVIGRRPHLPLGATMADLAADYANALTEAFNEKAVNVLGFSTGGSIALQFAADYPELVQRLTLAATAYRLGPIGREVQRQYADWLALGKFSRAYRTLAPLVSDSRIGQWFWEGILWMVGTLTRIEDPVGMVAMLRAEDAFDLGDRLHEITAPTLLIGGDQDCNYPPELLKQMTERIPHAHVSMYPGRNHNTIFTDRRFYHDVIAFLEEEQRP